MPVDVEKAQEILQSIPNGTSYGDLFVIAMNLILSKIDDPDDKATAEDFAYSALQIYRRHLPLLTSKTDE